MALIKFFGGAQQVTGSCHMLESEAFGTLLLDCGMHQGGDAVDRLEGEKFRFAPASVNALILSHAHLDHSGLIPMLYSQGFRGKIYCTHATRKLLEIMLEDALSIYERDLEHENLKRKRKGEKLKKALYSRRDVKAALKLCECSKYREPVSLTKDASVTFHDAGHILGSAIVEVKFTEKGTAKSLVFSGDLGKQDSVLMNNPACLETADVVLMEGTYGNRNHRTAEDTVAQLEQILAETWDRKGNVFIPAFAVGRTQEILYHLGCLHKEGKLDNWQVFVDSPMAIAVTKVYDECIHLLDPEDMQKIQQGFDSTIKDFIPHLKYTQTPKESMAINLLKQGVIVIAGSGMCTGGRIRHHFKQRIWNKRNTVIFAGFQAAGTLGRLLVDGLRSIKMFGDEFAVRARIETLGGFSAHAGQSELIDWLDNFKPVPRVFLVHGEAESLDALSSKLWEDKSIPVEIPFMGQTAYF